MDFRAFIIAIGAASLATAGLAFYPVVFQQSGIEGRVYQLSGNRMPSPRRLPGSRAAASSNSAPVRPDSTASGTSTPAVVPTSPVATPAPQGPGVKAVVCVFALTNDSQVIRQGTSPYCEAVHTRLIRQADTDDKGNFSILLPPGTYSVFTKKGDLFYATRRDEKNNIAPVKVLPGKMTRVDCSVESDHAAVY
jgi:hypothetical protein